MSRFWLKSGLVATTAAWSMAAFAQSSNTTVPASADPSATGKSMADAQVVAPVLKRLPIGLATDSYLYGPRVNTPTDNKITPDSNADTGKFTGIYLRQKIIGSYKLDEKTSIKPTLDFNYTLTDPNANRKHRREFRWKDSYVALSRKSLVEGNIKGNDLVLDGDIRWFVPSSESSRMNNNIGGARLTLSPSLQIGKTPFSISAVNYARYWFQTQKNDTRTPNVPDANGPNTSPLIQAELYTGPQVNYAISDKVTAFVLYETFVTFDTSGMPCNTTDKNLSQADFEPGVSFQIHDRLSLTPYLNWYTNQPLFTTTLNLNATITLL